MEEGTFSENWRIPFFSSTGEEWRMENGGRGFVVGVQ